MGAGFGVGCIEGFYRCNNAKKNANKTLSYWRFLVQ